MDKNKLYILIVILTSIFFFGTSAICTQCAQAADEEIEKEAPEIKAEEEKLLITSAKIESFSDVETIQIIVSQSYIDDKTGDKIKDFSLPIYDDCKTILENIGFSVVDKTEKEYDSKLEVKIKGIALFRDYLGEGSLYTGAELEGNIIFSADEIDSVEKNFSEIKEPPEYAFYKVEPKEPWDAPFNLGWQKHLFLLLCDIWGIETLSRSLDNKEKFIREQIVESLSELDDPEAVDILINLVDDKEWHVRTMAIQELGKKGDTEALDILIKMLKDENGWVRGAAATALGKIGDKSAVPALLENLEYGEGSLTIRTAAYALGEIGDTSAVPSLIETLKHGEHKLTRIAAAVALGDIGDTDAIEALEEALEVNEDEEVREACREAIEKILKKNSKV